jgi:uncharacterized membrane protein
MIMFPAVVLLIGSDLFDLPWYSEPCFAIFMGCAAVWAGLSDEPMSGRNGEPWPNQEFLHGCLLFLGVAMIILSLWGLWLGKP